MFAFPLLPNVSMEMAGIKIWATATRLMYKHDEYMEQSVWLLAYIRRVQINMKTNYKKNEKETRYSIECDVSTTSSPLNET